MAMFNSYVSLPEGTKLNSWVVLSSWPNIHGEVLAFWKKRDGRLTFLSSNNKQPMKTDNFSLPTTSRSYPWNQVQNIISKPKKRHNYLLYLLFTTYYYLVLLVLPSTTMYYLIVLWIDPMNSGCAIVKPATQENSGSPVSWFRFRFHGTTAPNTEKTLSSTVQIIYG